MLHSLNMNCAKKHPTTEYRMERRDGYGRVTLQWRNLTNSSSAMWSGLISTVISHVNCMYLLHVMRMAFHMTFFSKYYKLSLIMKKHRANTNWETFYKTHDQYSFKLWMSKETRKVWKIYNSQKKPKKTWWLTAMWCPE